MGKDLSRSLAGAVAALAAMVLVWAAAFQSPFARWFDQAMLQGFSGLRRGWVAVWTERVAHLGDPLPFGLAGAALILVALMRGRIRVAAAIGALLVIAPGCAQILKPLLADPRETGLAYANVAPASWPSGHATATMTLALCAVLAVPARLRPLAGTAGAMFSLAVTFSLLTHDWHFPSDVLGGYLLAAMWTGVAIAAVRATGRRPAHHGRRLASMRAALAVPAAAAGAAALAVAALAAGRPHSALRYAEDHTAFVVGAGALGIAALALAAGLAAALGRGSR